MTKYIKGNPLQPLDNLPISKSELNRKISEGAVKIGRPHLDEVWIKIGKSIYVIGKVDENSLALNAQIWWEYHEQLMPKVIKWEKI